MNVKLVSYLASIVLVSSIFLPVTGAMASAAPKATGGVGYDAYGLARRIEFNAQQTETECGWTVDGAYTIDFEYLSSHYVHDATITNQSGSTFDIAGGYPAGGPFTYAWNGTGTVTGNVVATSVDYTVGAIGTHMDMTGTIAPDGTMSGNWSDNYGGARTGAWSTATGAATLQCGGKGQLHYSDANNNWYNVTVQYVNVDGSNAWFAGPVTTASNSSWVGSWLFAKVHDGGTPGRNGDQVSGSFTTQAVAIAGVVNQSLPGDGPFDVVTGNLQVQ